MSNASADAVTVAFIGTTVGLGIAILAIYREPFRTLSRWLTAAWQAVYRATGAAALDRAIARRRAPLIVAEYRNVLALLPDGPRFDASRDRLNEAIAAAEQYARH